MVTIIWGWQNESIDFITGENVPDDVRTFDPEQDAIGIDDPAAMASEFEAFDTDIGLVLRPRDVDIPPPTDGSFQPGPPITNYVVFPDLEMRALGSPPGNPAGGNFIFNNGDEFRIGDGTTGTTDDDGPNHHEPGPDANTNYFKGLGGNDTARGAPGGSRLYGNTGDDSLLGGPGGDSIFGGQGHDVIDDGGAPALPRPVNLLSGDLGNDQILAAPGAANTIYGGPGDDHFSWSNPNDVDIVDATNVLFGGADNDTVIANGLSGELTINGDRGADEIQVNAFFGDLRVHLGLGSDILEIADRLDGNTTVTGDGGADRIEFLIQPGAITVDGGDDGDTIRAEPGTPTGETSISVGGGEGGDLIETTGLIRNGTFRGEGGDDRIIVNPDGTLANAQFYGIVLDGGPGNDTIQAGQGSTHIVGGPGRDELFGGNSRDRFGFFDQPDGDADTISNFTPQFDGVLLTGDWAPSTLQVYCSDNAAGAGANHNFLVALGQSFDINSFQDFLEAGAADTDKPGFYFFTEENIGALLYFDDDMTSTAGAVRVLVMPEVTQPDQLAAYAFETFYTF